MLTPTVVPKPRRARNLLFAAVAALAACGDNGPKKNSHLSFDYSGAVTGSYSVVGAASDESDGGVMAFLEDTLVIVLAMKSGDLDGLAVLAFSASASGNVPIVACEEEDEPCVVMGFEASSGALTVTCTLSAGTIVLTANTPDRATGSFGGTGACFDSDSTSVGTITVSNGSFDSLLMGNPFGAFPPPLRERTDQDRRDHAGPPSTARRPLELLLRTGGLAEWLLHQS